MKRLGASPPVPENPGTEPAGAPPGVSAGLDACAAAWAHAHDWRELAAPLAGLEAAAGHAGHVAFQDVCVLLQECLRADGEGSPAPGSEHGALLEQWLRAARAYLGGEATASDTLVGLLQDARWPQPVAEEEAAMLRELLASPTGPGAPAWEPSPDNAADGPSAADDATWRQALGQAAEPGVVRDDGATAEEAAGLDAGWPEPGPEPASPGADTGKREQSEAVREMVALLRDELAEVESLVAECVQAVEADAGSAQGRAAALAHLAEQFERFGEAAAVIGFQALKRICDHMHGNLIEFGRREAAPGAPLRTLLTAWPERVRAYLNDPDDAAACAALARHACDEAWPAPLTDVDELVRLLVSPALGADEADETPPRPSEARPEDVALTLPEDVDAALLDGLLQELPTQTAAFTDSVQRLAGEGGVEHVEAAQRVAHTLKGAANTVGVAGVANLTHHLEDILLALARHATLPGPALAGTLMDAADCLEMMSEALLGQGPGPDDALGVLQRVLDWARRIDREGVAAVHDDHAAAARAPDPAPSASLEDAVPDASREEPPAHVSPQAQASEPAPHPMQEPAEGERPTMRIPAALVDDLLRLSGESIILTGQVQEGLRRAIAQSRAMHEQYQLLQQLGQELEQLIDVRALTLPSQASAVRDFDPLELEQYNELHTCSRRLVEAATDARELGRGLDAHLAALDEMLGEQSRLNRESQEAVLHTRMVAVKTVVPRIQRSVRQASRVSGKRVELECRGTETMMDGDVLGSLVDPLMHVLRNSVDHGIEPEDVRRAAGKDPVGHVRLEFQREGNHVLVQCADDGSGLDWEAIRRVAEQQGLVRADQPVSEDELAALVLRPNFTTRTQATQLSGRGIGLDAVHAAVSRLGGSMTLRSEPGRGCRVELRMPLTLISTHALLVRIARHVFAVSSRGVVQILHGEAGEEARLGREPGLRVEDQVYPLTSLENLVGLGEERRSSERSPGPVLLVRDKSAVHAVRVQAVLDSRDLVVKSLGRYVPKLRGIAGATILGDGSVAPVLDLPELLREPLEAMARPADEAAPAGLAEPATGARIALIVDDSLSARRSLSEVVSDSGFQVRTARDGLEAIEIIERQRPDVVLVDLEMPRMNGLELTQHLRAREDTRELPVLMITSRSTRKHRQQAEAAGVNGYLTKPFAEDELLEQLLAACPVSA